MVALIDAGYTDQKKLRDFIYDQTSVPYEQLPADEIQGIRARIETSIAESGNYADRIPADIVPVYQQALKAGGKVPLIVRPDDDIHIVVAGAENEASIQRQTRLPLLSQGRLRSFRPYPITGTYNLQLTYYEWPVL